MFLAHIVLVAYAFLNILKYVPLSQAQVLEEDADLETTSLSPHQPRKELQQKVALIDVSYTDGTKKICTGAIIHDSVVITAGHCFLTPGRPEIMPEMTTTFVVIGSKKMFETGYEQYLPVERIVTHPDMNGWTADLALVHTFASMVEDNVGDVIQLASNVTAAIETNVTIMSWGTMETNDFEDTKTPKKRLLGVISQGSSQEEVDYKLESKPGNRDDETESLRYNHFLTDSQQIEEDARNKKGRRMTTHKTKRTHRRTHKAFDVRGGTEAILMKGRFKGRDSPELVEYVDDGSIPKRSPVFRHPVQFHKSRSGRRHMEKSKYILSSSERKLQNNYTNSIRHRKNKVYYGPTESNERTYTGQWRRQLRGWDANKLTVEKFTLVTPSCKKYIERVHVGVEINSEEIICFISESHYVTEADIGAPVILHGRLFGITVGSFIHETEHVAVAIKVIFHCNWIEQNLPSQAFPFMCLPTEDLEDSENINVPRSFKKIKHKKLYR